MQRVKLEIAYDGTNYHGWQLQPHAVTIEGVINEKLSQLCQEDIRVIGASRTDAGVHAYGNVAVFDTESKIPPERFAMALNALLPTAIRVQRSFAVPADFHPRHCDSIKTYEYHILNRRIAIPTRRMYAYHFHWNLDLEAMREAAGYLVGKHDFVCFCSSKTQVKDTTRTIYSMTIEERGDELVLRVQGNGFLYNMVRIITGTLLQVGTKHFTPEYVKELLTCKDRSKGGACAPAHGLFLVEIAYPDLEAQSPMQSL